MDVPLDDLVKANRRGGRRRGGGRFGGNDNRTGGGAFRRSRNTQRSNPYRSNRGGGQGSSEGVWEHDRFDDEEEEEEEVVETTAPTRRTSSGAGGLETGAKLQISNLAFSVNDDDVKDLFEPLGDVKKAFVHYDKSGRSLGTATVVYARKDSAVNAIKKYNGVPLDGQAMKISLIATTGGSVASGGGGGGASSSSSGGGLSQRSFRRAVDEATRITVSVPNNNNRRSRPLGGRRIISRPTRGGGGGGGRGRGGGGRGRGRGRQVTKEELDAEMDEYINATAE